MRSDPEPLVVLGITNQTTLAVDRNIQSKSAFTLAKYSKMDEFAEKESLLYSPEDRGIIHQAIVNGSNGHEIFPALVVSWIGDAVLSSRRLVPTSKLH